MVYPCDGILLRNKNKLCTAINKCIIDTSYIGAILFFLIEIESTQAKPGNMGGWMDR